MPIFELSCNKCGTKFDELLRSLNQLNNAVDCPKCGGRDVIRIFSVFSMRSSTEINSNNQSKYSNSNKCSGCHGSSCSSCGG